MAGSLTCSTKTLFKTTTTFSFKIVYCETQFQAAEGRKSEFQIRCPNFRADWTLRDPSGRLQPQCSSSIFRARLALLSDELAFFIPIHHPLGGGVQMISLIFGT